MDLFNAIYANKLQKKVYSDVIPEFSSSLLSPQLSCPLDTKFNATHLLLEHRNSWLLQCKSEMYDL